MAFLYLQNTRIFVDLAAPPLKLVIHVDFLSREC